MSNRGKPLDDRNAAPMALLDRAMQLRCDSMNVYFDGHATGRVGSTTVELGSAEEFLETYGHLVPDSGAEATVLRTRAQDGRLKLRLATYLNEQISVHLLWLGPQAELTH